MTKNHWRWGVPCPLLHVIKDQKTIFYKWNREAKKKAIWVVRNGKNYIFWKRLMPSQSRPVKDCRLKTRWIMWQLWWLFSTFSRNSLKPKAHSYSIHYALSSTHVQSIKPFSPLLSQTLYLVRSTQWSVHGEKKAPFQKLYIRIPLSINASWGILGWTFSHLSLYNQYVSMAKKKIISSPWDETETLSKCNVWDWES